MATFPAHRPNGQNPIHLTSEDLNMNKSRPREFFVAIKSPDLGSSPGSLYFKRALGNPQQV